LKSQEMLIQQLILLLEMVNLLSSGRIGGWMERPLPSWLLIWSSWFLQGSWNAELWPKHYKTGAGWMLLEVL
jgi:hypothetical protein